MYIYICMYVCVYIYICIMFVSCSNILPRVKTGFPPQPITTSSQVQKADGKVPLDFLTC